MNKLSIIIPCYNCEKTLLEAVESCYKQGFSEDEFEIVMVDDGSDDNTRGIMKEAAIAHNNIRTFFHEINKGGGATRNTATQNANADIIFCLDSDDLLPPNTLKKMHTHLTEKNCDGVGIHKSIKFIGNNTNNISCTHIFNRVNEKIEIEDLLQKKGLCSLYSTFMFTKKAFKKAGGYPTEHGFDTQGFAWRFLAAGLYAETCPDAAYLHRVQFHESYYLREFNNGKVNFNWQKIFFENIHLFSDDTQRFILSFNCSDFTRDIFSELTSRNAVFTSETDRKKITITTTEVNPISRNSLRGLWLRIKYRIRTYLKKNDNLKFFILSFYFFYEDIVSRLKANDSLLLIYSYIKLRLKKIIKYKFNSTPRPTDTMVDILIPTIGKDFPLLESYIKQIKENICEKIGTIYIIAPTTEKNLISFCERNNIKFVDEKSVLGYGKDAINYTFNGINRSGWLFQQLLKLSGDKFIQNKKYIIIDSDTLLLNPHHFLENGKYVFFENSEWNEPYFKSFQNLFGYTAPHKLSLTSHMMIFDVDKLDEMKKEIETKHKMSWDKAYIKCCDFSAPSGISDYDTYAQWMIRNHPNEVLLKPFYNRSMSRSNFENFPLLKEKIRKSATSLSFHSYN